ncbi:hypothetical protein VNO77_00654 [Canavalia gladiata]|uniref:Uncharacterized protein n=1 Tax=Canavalia gladiata TaxID=3824 RepID=A0AAN9R4K5_CANGL
MVHEPNEKRRRTEQKNGREEHEQVLIALIHHRTREVKNLRYYITYYTSQLDEAERKLKESQSKLTQLRGQSQISQSKLLLCRSPTAKSEESQGLSSEQENVEIKKIGTYSKFAHKEHKELVPLVCKSSTPGSVKCQLSKHFSSLHKRKLRCIAVCPVNDRHFVTSALDGVVNLWEIQSLGSKVSLFRTTDCASPMQRRWPEDIAWHPDGSRLFSVYSADGQDSQISVTDLGRGQRGGRAQQKQVVLSAGKDKRIVGYDAHEGRQDFTHQVMGTCTMPTLLDVVHDYQATNLTPERQLRLFDVRSNGKELHAFGWKQESSESQSALINQAWSPNGLYITSGSADPMIHIFDIRYNGHKPFKSVEAHQKRVFRAMWLQSIPCLISISSDLNIGLHKVV